MSDHSLKTVQPYFDDVLHGRKAFEVRKNDRDFKVGDTLELEEYAPGVGYSGQAIIREVTYLLDSPEYCKPGYVVLGINNPTDARRAAITASISLDRLEAICNAEREQRCVVLPTVPKADRDLFAAELREYFNELAIVDRSVGLVGMSDGEAALANAIMDVLTRAEADAALAGQEEGRGCL